MVDILVVSIYDKLGRIFKNSEDMATIIQRVRSFKLLGV